MKRFLILLVAVCVAFASQAAEILYGPYVQALTEDSVQAMQRYIPTSEHSPRKFAMSCSMILNLQLFLFQFTILF